MEDIEAFIAVIGRSLQSVNRSLVALEKSVGVELVRRTTRRSFATEAGLAFYRRVKPAVSEIGEARLEAASRRDGPSGLLRIAAPVQFAAAFVVPAIAQFMRRYPRIEVDLKVSDQAVDVVGKGHADPTTSPIINAWCAPSGSARPRPGASASAASSRPCA